MAKKEDGKKQRKRLKEQKRHAQTHRQRAAFRYLHKYPRIKVISAGGDPTLVTEVQRLVSEFSFEDPECCPEEMRLDFKRFAEKGFGKFSDFLVKKQLQQVIEESKSLTLLETMPTGLDRTVVDKEVAEYLAFLHFSKLESHLGNWLFKHLPKRFTEGSPVRYFFLTELKEPCLQISFDLLEVVGESDNPLYLFPGRATVAMQGVTWEVALYHHALERLSHRLGQHATSSYSRWVEIHSILRFLDFTFVPVALSDGTEAVRVDRELDLSKKKTGHDFDCEYTREILGLPEGHVFLPHEIMSTVVGYLPLQIQGKYARAKTFLLPGFSKTPEGELARQKAKTPTERLLLQNMSGEDRVFALRSDMMKALKWYHDNGVPQVFSQS